MYMTMNVLYAFSTYIITHLKMWIKNVYYSLYYSIVMTPSLLYLYLNRCTNEFMEVRVGA